MGVAAGADDLFPNHAVTHVLDRTHVVAGKRQPETGPPAGRVVLVI